MIEKGCVVEQGTHGELLAQDGVYKQLVMRQLMAGESNGTSQVEDSYTATRPHGEKSE